MHLTIEKPAMSEVERRKQQMRDMAKLNNWDAEKLEALEVLLKYATTMEDIDTIPEKLQSRTKLEQIRLEKGFADEEDCQKVIEESELEEYLAKGYRFVSVLPSGKIVVED